MYTSTNKLFQYGKMQMTSKYIRILCRANKIKYICKKCIVDVFRSMYNKTLLANKQFLSIFFSSSFLT